jgi:hypothetical protein
MIAFVDARLVKLKVESEEAPNCNVEYLQVEYCNEVVQFVQESHGDNEVNFVCRNLCLF